MTLPPRPKRRFSRHFAIRAVLLWLGILSTVRLEAFGDEAALQNIDQIIVIYQEN